MRGPVGVAVTTWSVGVGGGTSDRDVVAWWLLEWLVDTVACCEAELVAVDAFEAVEVTVDEGAPNSDTDSVSVRAFCFAVRLFVAESAGPMVAVIVTVAGVSLGGGGGGAAV